MRTVLITVAAGRHTHLLRQRTGLAAGTVQPDRHVVVAMGDPQIKHLLDGEPRTDVVELAVHEQKLPLARARNAGADHALSRGAELLVFLDVDCIPGAELVRRYQHLAADRTLLCGPVTYLEQAADHRPQHLAASTNPHPARPVPDDDHCLRHGDHRLFWSLSFAVTAATWRAIGGFCEEYTGYGGEDTDFGQLARHAGIDLWWVGGAHAYHQHHPVQDPPMDHIDDIVANATLFHGRWGWWPMTGWLTAFSDRGLITFEPDTDSDHCEPTRILRR